MTETDTGTGIENHTDPATTNTNAGRQRDDAAGIGKQPAQRDGSVPVLFTHWFDFTNWLFDRTMRFPKNIRHTVTNRLEVLALDILMGVVEARYRRAGRSERLAAVNLDLEKLRVLLRLCHARHLLSNSQYEHASRETETAGRMVGGWQRFAIENGDR